MRDFRLVFVGLLRHPILMAGVLLACLSTACASKPAPQPEKTISADTWATVDEREIVRDEVDKAYRRLSDTSQTLSEEETLSAKLTLLNDLIIQNILLAKAAQLKLDVPQTELDNAYTEASKNVSAEVFQQELTKRNLSTADMREGLRRELLTQKVIEQDVVAKVTVPEQEISGFFSANRAQFNVPEESYHLAHIVVTPGRDAQVANRSGDDATTPQAATAKVQMLMERLKAGGSFSDLATAYSEDPASAPRGGDLGLVPISRLRQAPPQLRDAVLKKEPGTVNVATVGGEHTLVLVVAHVPAGQRDLSTPGVREGITRTLRARKEQLLRTAYLSAVRDNAKVVNYVARRLVESQGSMAAPSLQPVAPGAR